MADLTTRLKQATISNPFAPNADPWSAFRAIEVIELNWSQSYKHSLGKYSRFFLELENGRFFATRCPTCHKVWTPPRPACPDDLTITEWIELSGQGHIVSWSVLHYAPKMLAERLQTPYVLAYVKMDGADTLFAHLLQNYSDEAVIQHGLSVHVVYNKGPVAHPIMFMAFEPTNTAPGLGA